MDVSEFFARYAERYMAADAEAVADLCAAPFTAVRGGTPIHLPDRDAVVEHLTGLMAAYRQAGAARADIASIDVLSQGDRAQAVTVHWQVRSVEGAMIRDFRTTYQLVGPDPWRIVAYVNHDFVDGPRGGPIASPPATPT